MSSRSCVALSVCLVLSVPSSGLCGLGPGEAPSANSWIPGGTPVCLALGNQTLYQVIADGQGGAYFIWDDLRDGTHKIYAQRLDRTGSIAAGWPTDGLRISSRSSVQLAACGVLDNLGGLLIVWEDRTPWLYVCAQRLSPDGNVADGWPASGVELTDTVNAGSSLYSLVLQSDGAGGGIASWSYIFTNCDVNGNSCLYVKSQARWHHVSDDAGSSWSLSADYLVNTSSVSDGSGGVISVCVDEGRGGLTSMRFEPDGTRLWSVHIPDGSPGQVLASDAQGGGILAWHAGNATQLFAQKLTGAGDVAWDSGGVLLCSDVNQRFLEELVDDGAGGAFFTWIDERLHRDSDVYAARLQSDGTRPSEWPLNGLRVSSKTTYVGPIDAATDSLSGLFVVWQDDVGANAGIMGQHLLASGTPAPGWPVGGAEVCSSAFTQHTAKVACVAPGVAIVGWADYRSGSDYDIYATQLGDDAVVPALASFADASWTSRGVLLRWYTRADAAVTQRRQSSGPWQQLGAAVRVGEYAVFEDFDVIPGERYSYRLLIQDSGAWIEAASIHLVAPLRAQTLFVGAQSTPSVGVLKADIRLTEFAPAKAFLLDVQGRLLSEYSLDHLRPGSHTITLTGSANLDAGIYFLRVDQASNTATARFVVVE